MNKSLKILLGAAVISATLYGTALFAQPMSEQSPNQDVFKSKTNSESIMPTYEDGLEKITLEQLKDSNYEMPSHIRSELQQYLSEIIDKRGRWSIEAFGPLELKINEESEKIKESPYIKHFVFPADKEFYFNPPVKVSGADPITSFDIIFTCEDGIKHKYDGLAKEPIKLPEGLYYVEFRAYTDKEGSDKKKRRIQFASVRGWATGRKVPLEEPEFVSLDYSKLKELQVILPESELTDIKLPELEEPKEKNAPKILNNSISGRVSYSEEDMNNEPYLSNWSVGVDAIINPWPVLFLNGLFEKYFGKFENTKGNFDKTVFGFGTKLKKEFSVSDYFNLLAGIGADFNWEKADIDYDIVEAWVEELKLAGVLDVGFTSKNVDLTLTGRYGIGRSGDSFQGYDPMQVIGGKVNPIVHFVTPRGILSIGAFYDFEHKQQEVRGAPRDYDKHTFGGNVDVPVAKHIYLGAGISRQVFQGFGNDDNSWKILSIISSKF